MKPSRKSVTADNLAALGTARLAALLVDIADEDAAVKRRLRLELAAQAGGDVVAADIGRRLSAIATAQSFIDWRKQRDFVRDLDLQRSMILERVAPTHPDLALDLLWRFLALAGPVFNRVDDSNGGVGDVFRSACTDLGTVAAKADPDPLPLAERVVTALLTDDYGIHDGLAAGMVPALGPDGTAHLKERLARWLTDQAGAQDRDWRAGGVRRALCDIADEEADIDAFVALVPLEERQRPEVGAEITRRLLAAGRADEAMAALQAATPWRDGTAPHHASGHDGDLFGLGLSAAWEDMHLAVLDATGQHDEAQRQRWAAFERRLSVTSLRDYLSRLPDFEDIEAEEKAMRHALAFPSFAAALRFLEEWPHPRQAATLVETRAAEINGDLYFLLDPAATLLDARYPLAATLLRRAMILDTLEGAKARRYKHAVRHLHDCAAVASDTTGAVGFEDHAAFVARLRARHGRKAGFWSRVASHGEDGRSLLDEGDRDDPD